MNLKKTLIQLLLVALLLLGLMLVLPAPPAGAASNNEQAAADIEVVRERLLAIMDSLARGEGLTNREAEHLRGELADIYVDLNSIRAALDGGGSVNLPDGNWNRYSQADTSVLPRSASFSGWQRGNSLDIRIGSNEDIYLTVDNGYIAETHIPSAFQGAVKTRAEADSQGWVILEVSDSTGTREFRIDNGGLGPVYVRGRSTSPASPGGSVNIPSGAWDYKYLSMRQGGQVSSSAAMEWLRDQVDERAYASDSLRDLGEYLRQMEGEAAHQRVAELRWFSGSSEKRMDIPDPRVDVLSFINALNKVYSLDSSRDWYRIDLDQ